jgi:hypothetical protein
LVYLPTDRVVVCCELRLAGTWRCRVIAAHPPATVLGHRSFTEDHLATGHGVDSIDRDDPNLFLLAWQTGVHQHLDTDRAHTLARLLALTCAAARTRTLLADPGLRRRLVLAIAGRLPGLDRLFAKLTGAGLLIWHQPAGTTVAALTLTLPDRELIGGDMTDVRS